MTIIFTDTALRHWATAPFQEFPVDQKFVKTLFWPDLQIKCEKQNDVSCGEKKKKAPCLSSGQLKILRKLQHIVQVLVILNNACSYLQVAGVSFFEHNGN